jgi:hypothetical protein
MFEDLSGYLQYRNNVSGCILPAVLGRFLLLLSHLFPLHRLVDGSQWTCLFPEWRLVSASAAVIRKQYFDTLSNVASSTQITRRKFCYVEKHAISFWRHLFCCLWQSDDFIKHTNTVSRFVAEDEYPHWPADIAYRRYYNSTLFSLWHLRTWAELQLCWVGGTQAVRWTLRHEDNMPHCPRTE